MESLITDANLDEGQSLIEFLLMLPFMIGITLILIHVNTAIQASIVDQQYARAQALFLTFNSPFYPELSHQTNDLVGNMTNQMVVGVSDNKIVGGNNTPIATTLHVPRSKTTVGPDEPHSEPDLRAKVRVRNTVTLCTPTVVTGNGAAVLELDQNQRAVGQTILGENFRWDYMCGSKLKYYE